MGTVFPKHLIPILICLVLPVAAETMLSMTEVSKGPLVKEDNTTSDMTLLMFVLLNNNLVEMRW